MRTAAGRKQLKVPAEYEDLVEKLQDNDVLKMPHSPFGGRNPLGGLATPYTNRGKGTVLVKENDFEVLKKTRKHLLIELL